MWQRPQRKKNAAGFTILETIIAVSILGAVLSGFAVLNRTPDVRLYSDDVQAIVQQARLEAVKQNRPVAFLWDAIAGEFSTRYAPSPAASTVAAACASTTILVRRATDEYRAVNVATALPGNGLVWLPNTLLSTCAGAMTGTQTIVISNASQAITISISTAGQVTLE